MFVDMQMSSLIKTCWFSIDRPKVFKSDTATRCGSVDIQYSITVIGV